MLDDDQTSTETTVLAATRAAKKAVPAEAMSLEEGAGGPAQSQAAGGTALGQPPKEDSEAQGKTRSKPDLMENPEGASSSRGPEPTTGESRAADRPALGQPLEEDSEAQRKTRSKRVPDLVSEQEFRDHMMTHLPYRS